MVFMLITEISTYVLIRAIAFKRIQGGVACNPDYLSYSVFQVRGGETFFENIRKDGGV